jgi:hypothetical protein
MGRHVLVSWRLNVTAPIFERSKLSIINLALVNGCILLVFFHLPEKVAIAIYK